MAQLNIEKNSSPKIVIFQVLRGPNDDVGLQAILESVGIQRDQSWALLNYAKGNEKSILFWNGDECPPPGLFVTPLPDLPPF